MGPIRVHDPAFGAVTGYTSSQKINREGESAIALAQNSPVLSSPEYQRFGKVTVICLPKKCRVWYGPASNAPGSLRPNGEH